jgi:pimeloyl-[acyl-carrier protein] methyl ester esterase
MNLRVFDSVRQSLAVDFPSWAIDLPGHGRSSWTPQASFEVQTEQLLAALPERCVMLGWSLGGKFALELARRAPARVDALVLIAATPKFAQAADWPHGADAGARGVFRAMLEQDWHQTLDDFLWLQLRGSRNAELAQARLQQALQSHGSPSIEALRRDLDLLDELDLRQSLPAVSQPALVVAGQHDRVTPPAAARVLAATLPRGRYVEIARAAHAPFVSHVEEFTAVVREFLDSLSAANA